MESLISSTKAKGHKIVKFVIESKSTEKGSEEPIYHSVLQIIDMKDTDDQRIFYDLISAFATRKRHLPYPSPMGHYLQSTLEMNSKLVVLCTLSPALSAYEKSIFTINAGINARKIEQSIYRNIVENTDKALICLYEKELDSLEKKLNALEQNIKKFPELGQTKKLIQNPNYRKNVALYEKESGRKRMSELEVKNSPHTEERKQLLEQIRTLKSCFLNSNDETSTTSYPSLSALDITLDMERKLEKTFSSSVLRVSSDCPLDSSEHSPFEAFDGNVIVPNICAAKHSPKDTPIERYQERLKDLKRQVRTLEIVKDKLFDENEVLRAKVSERARELVRVRAEIARYKLYLEVI